MSVQLLGALPMNMQLLGALSPRTARSHAQALQLSSSTLRPATAHTSRLTCPSTPAGWPPRWSPTDPAALPGPRRSRPQPGIACHAGCRTAASRRTPAGRGLQSEEVGAMGATRQGQGCRLPLCGRQQGREREAGARNGRRRQRRWHWSSVAACRWTVTAILARPVLTVKLVPAIVSHITGKGIEQVQRDGRVRRRVAERRQRAPQRAGSHVRADEHRAVAVKTQAGRQGLAKGRRRAVLLGGVTAR